MIPQCSEFFESSTHMFLHDRHEYIRAKSLTFPYIAAVFEELLLAASEVPIAFNAGILTLESALGELAMQSLPNM